jgi:predicted esterase
MSWGERSCENYGNCTRKPTMFDCNVDCEGYRPNGKEPDSRPREVQGLLVDGKADPVCPAGHETDIPESHRSQV